MTWKKIIRAPGGPPTWALDGHPEWTIERVGHGFHVWHMVDTAARRSQKLGAYSTLARAQEAVANSLKPRKEIKQ